MAPSSITTANISRLRSQSAPAALGRVPVGLPGGHAAALPAEILTQILEHVDAEGLHTASQTCKHWYHVSGNVRLLKAALQPTSRKLPSTLARLSRLVAAKARSYNAMSSGPYTTKVHTWDNSDVTYQAVSPTGRFVVAIDTQYLATLHDFAFTPARTAALGTAMNAPGPPLFSGDGRSVLIESGDGSATVYPLGRNTAPLALPNAGPGPHCWALSADARVILGGSAQSAILWRLRPSGYAIGGSKPLISRPRAVALSPNKRYLALMSEAGTINVHDKNVRSGRGRTLGTRCNPGFIPAFSPDSSSLLTIDLGGPLRVWDIKSTDPTSQAFGRRGFTSAAFTPDGGLLAGGLKSNALSWWPSLLSPQHMRQLPAWPETSPRIRPESISPDGRFWVAVTPQSVSLRKMEDGTHATQKIPVPECTQEVLKVSFTPDGRSVLARLDSIDGESLIQIDFDPPS